MSWLHRRSAVRPGRSRPPGTGTTQVSTTGRAEVAAQRVAIAEAGPFWHPDEFYGTAMSNTPGVRAGTTPPQQPVG